MQGRRRRGALHGNPSDLLLGELDCLLETFANLVNGADVNVNDGRHHESTDRNVVRDNEALVTITLERLHHVIAKGGIMVLARMRNDTSPRVPVRDR